MMPGQKTVEWKKRLYKDAYGEDYPDNTEHYESASTSVLANDLRITQNANPLIRVGSNNKVITFWAKGLIIFEKNDQITFEDYPGHTMKCTVESKDIKPNPTNVRESITAVRAVY